MRKYLFFDIDNTLTIRTKEESIVPDSAREALRRLEERGHFTAIATGRSYAMAKGFFDELGFRNMVHDGGNGITINGKMLGIEPLDKEKCLALIRECDEKGILWGLTPDDSIYRLSPFEDFEKRAGDSYMITTWVPDLDPEKLEKIHKVYVLVTPEEEKDLRTLQELPHVRYCREYTFIEPTEKERGIYRVLDYFGADPADVVVFGDGYNDLSMFRPEWTSIAMGNAVPELKEKADYVTTDNAHDGIFNACRHFGWI